MNNLAHLKTRVQRWAEEITGAYGNSVEAIIEVGRKLQQAKAECSHGEWGELTGETNRKPLLPFSHQTARRLKAIANNTALSNRAHVRDLPASWGTLALLAQLDPEDIEAAIADGTIHPEMERKDAEALKARIQGPRAKPPAAAPLTEVVPITSATMPAEEREAWDATMKECGQMIADYADRQAENHRIASELGERFPLSSETRQALAAGEEILGLMRALNHKFTHAAIPPRFEHTRDEAIDLARGFVKHLEKLS